MKRLLPVAVLALALSACASQPPQATAAFCDTYEQSWSAFVEARDVPGRDNATYVAQRQELWDTWSTLADDETVSEDTRETVAGNLKSFRKAVGGDVDEQLAFQQGHQDIADRCSDAGAPIVLAE